MAMLLGFSLPYSLISNFHMLFGPRDLRRSLLLAQLVCVPECVCLVKGERELFISDLFSLARALSILW